LVREQLPHVEARLRARGLDPSADLADLSSLEAERRRLIPLVENLKREQNEAGELVARAKREGRDPSGIFAENKARAGRVRELETELAGIEQRRDARLLVLPNLPHESVPVGKSANDNVEVRTWGTKPVMDFAPRGHLDLGLALGIVDFERATRMSGARFAVLMGAGAPARRAR
jgi:seryl-tRNA synthetase